MLKRLLREPLTHFTILAVLIFAGYGVLNRAESGKPDRIVVTAPKIQQLAEVFAKAWQRPPTLAELKGLIDDYVKEEIYVREALALGLDKNDTVIRRRLRIKMEFLSESETEALAPTDAELDAYLKAHPEKFEIDPMMSLQQIYLDPKRRGDRIDQDTASILEVLLTRAPTDPDALGDATLLPSVLPLTTRTSIAQTFGREFADGLGEAPLGRWTGPIKSTFGFHIVRVAERKPGHVPTLEEVHDVVAREWANEKRAEFEKRRFDELLKRYEVTIENPPETAANR
jgi:hypothetical protein